MYIHLHQFDKPSDTTIAPGWAPTCSTGSGGGGGGGGGEGGRERGWSCRHLSLRSI